MNSSVVEFGIDLGSQRLSDRTLVSSLYTNASKTWELGEVCDRIEECGEYSCESTLRRASVWWSAEVSYLGEFWEFSDCFWKL
ncbi:MAG TPA: hypothetical protein V6C85_15095 [Allocoleopsis sp.]